MSPTLKTLDVILRACGKELLLIDRLGTGIDRTTIRAHVHHSPGDRARIAQNQLNRARRRQPATARDPLFEPLLVLHALEAHEVRFILTGAFAEALRGAPMTIAGLEL